MNSASRRSRRDPRCRDVAYAAEGRRCRVSCSEKPDHFPDDHVARREDGTEIARWPWMSLERRSA